MRPPSNFIAHLRQRGMLQDIMADTESYLSRETTSGYIGFDPTADSLHIGNLAQIMTLVHFQQCGHKPLILLGGATGMIGDPSGKSSERTLLAQDTLNQNLLNIRKQLEKFLRFDGPNAAEIINNYDWFKNMGFLEFIREVGKHITVNYMLAKDAIQTRLKVGLSFTEFCYQLAQAYDFYWLYANKKCKLQMGGSDQWGNMVTGAELIRRKDNGKAFALTTPLLKKPDGSKFGKTEKGNIWLDPHKTSPYEFYQHWINCPDQEAEQYINIFTTRTHEEILTLIDTHKRQLHKRLLQKELAKDITILTHSKEEYNSAVQISNVLFGKTVTADLESMDESTLSKLSVHVPYTKISRTQWETCPSVTDLVSVTTGGIIFATKNEAKRMIQGGGVSINKKKLDRPEQKPAFKLLQNKYLLAQRGRKTYYLIEIA